jgi:hypothetical protein
MRKGNFGMAAGCEQNVLGGEQNSTQNHGDMSFKSLKAFNYTMFGKQACKLFANSGSLITRLFQIKYFSNCDFLESCIGHNPNYISRGYRNRWSANFVVQRV